MPPFWLSNQCDYKREADIAPPGGALSYIQSDTVERLKNVSVVYDTNEAAANHLVRELAVPLARLDAVVTLTKQAFTPSDQAEAITFCRVIGC